MQREVLSIRVKAEFWHYIYQNGGIPILDRELSKNKGFLFTRIKH